MGVNDIARGIPIKTIAANIEKIVLKIQAQSPRTSIYLQNILPVNPDFGLFTNHMKCELISELNVEVRDIAQKYHVTYIDLHTLFLDKKTNKLGVAYTNDGLHLLGNGYILWRNYILNFIND